jgi:hypothetical protein
MFGEPNGPNSIILANSSFWPQSIEQPSDAAYVLGWGSSTYYGPQSVYASLGTYITGSVFDMAADNATKYEGKYFGSNGLEAFYMWEYGYLWWWFGPYVATRGIYGQICLLDPIPGGLTMCASSAFDGALDPAGWGGVIGLFFSLLAQV